MKRRHLKTRDMAAPEQSACSQTMFFGNTTAFFLGKRPFDGRAPQESSQSKKLRIIVEKNAFVRQHLLHFQAAFAVQSFGAELRARGHADGVFGRVPRATKTRWPLPRATAAGKCGNRKSAKFSRTSAASVPKPVAEISRSQARLKQKPSSGFCPRKESSFRMFRPASTN